MLESFFFVIFHYWPFLLALTLVPALLTAWFCGWKMAGITWKQGLAAGLGAASWEQRLPSPGFAFRSCSKRVSQPSSGTSCCPSPAWPAPGPSAASGGDARSGRLA